MSRSLWVGVVSLGVALVPLASRASAATTSVLFSDNFEITADGGNDTDGALPMADVGAYDAPNSNGRIIAYGAPISSPTSTGVNVNAPAATDNGGSHLLRLQPPSGGGRDVAALSQPAAKPGTTFSLEFDLYASSNVNFGFGSQAPGEGGQTFGLAQPSTSRPHQSFLINLANGAVTVTKDTDGNPATANAASSTGLTFTTNTFQHYRIDYVIGTDQVTLTAGTQAPVTVATPFLSATDSDFDNTNGLTPLAVSRLSQVDTVFFGTGSAGSVGFVDNVVATDTPALPGDANLNGRIDPDDYALIDRGLSLGLTNWWDGDFDGNGVVDAQDYLIIDGSLASQSGFAPALLAARQQQFGAGYVSQLLASVPEPASLGLIALGGVTVGARRRRKWPATRQLPR